MMTGLLTVGWSEQKDRFKSWHFGVGGSGGGEERTNRGSSSLVIKGNGGGV